MQVVPIAESIARSDRSLGIKFLEFKYYSKIIHIVNMSSPQLLIITCSAETPIKSLKNYLRGNE